MWDPMYPITENQSNIQQIIVFGQMPTMVDQRTIPVHHLQHSSILNDCQLQRDLPPNRALKVCDVAVVDSPILQCYCMSNTIKLM